MFKNAKEPSASPGLQGTGPVYTLRGNAASFEIDELIVNEQKGMAGYKPAGEKMHAIIWIKEGWGQILIDMQVYNLHDDTIFYLKPGQLFRLAPHTIARGYRISFSASFLDMSEMFIGLSGASPCGQHSFFKTTISGAATKDELEDLVQEMIKESANHYVMGPEVLRGLIGIFMVHLARNSTTKKGCQGTNHDDQIAKKFMKLLNEHVHARKMVSDYANELAISANYLNQVLKRYTGFTASHHIQQYTILEAKRRALYFGTTMKETAYHLGFDDLAHFSKFFKKNAGTSFREFRNQLTGSKTRADTFNHSPKIAHA